MKNSRKPSSPWRLSSFYRLLSRNSCHDKIGSGSIISTKLGSVFPKGSGSGDKVIYIFINLYQLILKEWKSRAVILSDRIRIRISWRSDPNPDLVYSGRIRSIPTRIRKCSLTPLKWSIANPGRYTDEKAKSVRSTQYQTNTLNPSLHYKTCK